jgi:hypothetical protein
MPDFADALGASKAASTLLVLFIPSKDRAGRSIDQEYWVRDALRVLGTLFGGATAFPQGTGVWRDDARGGRLLFDEPVVIQCYTSAQSLEQQALALREFLHRVATLTREQSAWSLTVTTWRLASPSNPFRRDAGPKARNGGEEIMANNIDTIASRLGAKVIAKVPNTGGGAFGVARLTRIVAQLQARLAPGRGQRPGRPTDATWVRRPKVPMSKTTERQLARLAEQASTSGHKVSPMQVAACILEQALSGLADQ